MAAVVVVIKLEAVVEELVANATRDVVERLNVGPSFVRRLTSKIVSIAYNGFMASSKIKLGVGLLALGAISNDKALRTQGRLEILAASLFFMYTTSLVPQWVTMVAMVVLSFFFPLFMLLFFLVLWSLVVYEIPKIQDDPDALIKKLLLLRRYGILDQATSDLLDRYESQLSHSPIQGEFDAGPYAAATEWQEASYDSVFDAIRDALKDLDSGDQGTLDPGNTVPPVVVVRSSVGGYFVPVTFALAVAILIGRSK